MNIKYNAGMTKQNFISRSLSYVRLMVFAFTLGLTIALFLAYPYSASADEMPDPHGLVIVINPDTNVSSIDDAELRRLFTGKMRRLPNGARAALASYTPESSFFNRKMLDLSDAKVASLWARLRFSGRSPTPRTFNDVEALVEYVASTPNALAYIPASASRLGVRVLTNLPR